jgi:hypothetical protein
VYCGTGRLPLNQITSEGYTNHLSLRVANGLTAITFTVRLMIANLIGDVACQACWQTALR